LKNPKWVVEEMVAMADVYYRTKDSPSADIMEELKRLSVKLNKRAIALGMDAGPTFRNFNGMKLTYQCYRNVATNGKEGMTNTSRIMHEVNLLYNNNRAIFDRILKEFNEKY